MRKNLSLRRILLLVVMSVMLSASITLGAYSVLSPRIFAQAKLVELYPRAQYLAEQASQYFEKGDSQSMQLFGMDSRQWEATVYLVDADHRVLAHSNFDEASASHVIDIESFDSVVQEVLDGKELTYVSYLVKPAATASSPVDLLFIGLPVTIGDSVVGAVIMLKPLEEIISAMSTLSSTLRFSMMTVLFCMMPLVYWLSKRITLPIHEMRQAALRMAAGDFLAQANDQEKGEIGDLAHALNHLCRQLGNTIGELTHERNQAVAIINTLGEGILAVDAQGHPTQINPALQTMMMVAGKGTTSPLPPEIWDDYQIALKENRSIDRNFLFGELLIHATITPISDGRMGQVSAIGVFRDETQAHQLEQTRRDYVANVSHELRTPLTALRAMIEPLRDGLIHTEEKRRETYDIILRETMRLSRLVDDMLELSRLQRGRLALEKIRFPLEPVLHDTASIYAAKAADTGHILVLDVPSSTLPPVLGNPDRIEQVLAALLNNAFTYAPPGSRIVLQAEAREDHVRITVEDNGPGIRPEDLPHVFERFYKADKSHGGTGGTGLGLAIAREMLQKLGENITAENCGGGGARFSFTVHYE